MKRKDMVVERRKRWWSRSKRGCDLENEGLAVSRTQGSRGAAKTWTRSI